MAAGSQASFAFHTCSNQKACANFHKKSRSGMTPLGFRKRLPVSQFRRCHTMDEPREGCVLGQRKNAGDTAGERRVGLARERPPETRPRSASSAYLGSRAGFRPLGGRRQVQSHWRKGHVFDIYLIHSGTHL
jgi:hypothetical protein